MSTPNICHTCKYFRNFKYGAGCGIKKQILTEKQQEKARGVSKKSDACYIDNDNTHL